MEVIIYVFSCFFIDSNNFGNIFNRCVFYGGNRTEVISTNLFSVWLRCLQYRPDWILSLILPAVYGVFRWQSDALHHAAFADKRLLTNSTDYDLLTEKRRTTLDSCFRKRYTFSLYLLITLNLSKVRRNSIRGNNRNFVMYL